METTLQTGIGEDFVDNSLRPNQIIALSLEYVPVHRENAMRAFEAVRDSLLTPLWITHPLKG